MVNPFTFNYHAHIDDTFKPAVTCAKPNEVVHITLDTDNCVTLMLTDTQMRMLRATLDEAIAAAPDEVKPVAVPEPLAVEPEEVEPRAGEYSSDYPF